MTIVKEHIVRDIISETRDVLIEFDASAEADSCIIVTINGYDGVDYTRMSVEELKAISNNLNEWVKSYDS